MLKIREYVRAESLEEAWQLYQKRSSVVLGGMLWLRLQNRSVGTAIDLSGLGLDTIERREDGWHIGAMTTLRALETHRELNALTHGALADCLRPIIGVQFRNMATVGGSLSGKFGFSDPLTLFLALGARVVLYRGGTLPLEEFLTRPSDRDILVEVLLPAEPVQAVYRSQRNTATDFPVLTCALCRRAGALTCAIGARPGAARLFRDEEGLLREGITAESADAFAGHIAKICSFGSNLRAGAEYRQRICRVLVRRGLLALREED